MQTDSEQKPTSTDLASVDLATGDRGLTRRQTRPGHDWAPHDHV
ncbi:hypothetical protein ACOT81_09905 [Streptomyces sp. WI04-05B]|nr:MULTISPECIES: hypothetical protein [unclassified Streptomyces]MDX2547252.1 hypothetical protein [Streptomyces sp. WI04-05B]MDX2590178.1 hypothetical protein [Streptomyces sp. WI04-05A]